MLLASEDIKQKQNERTNVMQNLVLIRRWTHLIPPLTPHSPFVSATSCPDPNIDPQVDQAYFAPHGFNYNISKTSLLYRLSLICFWHLRTSSKNRTNDAKSHTVCVSHYRVPGEIKRKEVPLLDPQLRRDHEQGGGAGLESWTSFASGCSSTAV